VQGPTAVFFTTTNPDVDPETMSRFFVTGVDESREQTRAILSLQRRHRTLAGRQQEETMAALTRRHRNFQRLLRPLQVVNPYAEQLVYGDDRLQSRRDQPKYLNLIGAVAFLRQMQKKVERFKGQGSQGREYLTVDSEDIRIANDLACRILGRSLDELNSVSRDLLMLLDRMVADKRNELAQARGGSPPERRELTFTRRDIREYSGWPHVRVARYLKQLVELEYVVPRAGSWGVRFLYSLAYDGQGKHGEPFVLGLREAAELPAANQGASS